MARRLLCLLLFFPLLAQADWQLNNKLSRFHFVSVKALHVGEVHRFHNLEGAVTATGDATVEIDLSSVDTGVGIRDDRMRDLLFQTGQYPRATLATTVAVRDFEKLGIGRFVTSSQEVAVQLHGQEQIVTAELLVTRLGPKRFLVSSERPVMVQAGQFALVEGVEKLREIVGLPSISHAVPVSFHLVFDLP